ncbi:MAG: ATP-binding protein [Jatrophihabitans sp.]
MAAPIERILPAAPGAPRTARGFATTAVSRLLPAPIAHALCEDIELVVSELVTNAVRAGSDTVTISVEHVPGELGDDKIVLRVTDNATGWPEQRDAGVHDVTGRGLTLVSAICSAWGVRLIATGKIVWAELAIPRHSDHS